LLANGLALGLLARVRHVPAVAGLLDQARIRLVEISQILEVAREVAVHLTRHRSPAVVVEEPLVEDELQLNRCLMRGPSLQFPHKSRLKLLEALRLVLKLLTHPLNCTRLVVHEKRELPKCGGGIPLAIVLGDLSRKEEH